MRILVAGWVNSPHVTGWAAMVAELGHEVALVGHRAPGWPAAEPPSGLAAYEELRLGGAPLLKSLALGRDLRRGIARLRPELVHAHWLPEYGWLAARADVHPLVCSAWGSDVLGAGRLGRRRSAAAIRGADLVLADSAVLAQAARALAPRGAPVEVFHPGVDLGGFRPGDRGAARRALGWPADEVPIVLSPRAASPLYNQPTVIAAVARLRERWPGIRLVIKHPGDSLPAAVRATIEEAGMAGSVDVVGNVEAPMMPLLYQAANVVVSVPSSDSSPATAWEALACGRPLVVSDLPWAQAELHHGVDAWVVPIEAGALADALGAILGDAAMSVELAAGGRRLAEATMDRRAKMAELDRRYRALGATAASSPPRGGGSAGSAAA